MSMATAMTSRITNRDDLIVSHIFLARAMARKMKSHLPPRVDLDDLTSAGHVGLVQAADRFDTRIGTPFRKFASGRIRGAMLDMTRGDDWAPRVLRAEARASGESLPAMIPFTVTGWVNIDRPCAVEGLAHNPAAETVSQLLSLLDDRSRRVVSMRYLDGLTVKVIAAILRLSTSRISQIKKKALRIMRYASREGSRNAA